MPIPNFKECLISKNYMTSVLLVLHSENDPASDEELD